MQKYVFRTQKFDAIKLPTIRETRGKDFVSYGDNNLYPNLLIELYNNSAMHHTAVDAKTDAITGEGLRAFGDRVVNSRGETMNDIWEKISKDFILFGGYSLNVIWSNDGSTIAEYYHLPFNNIRSGKMNEEEDIEEYFYSQDWSNTRKNKPVAYPAFSTTDNRGNNASQVFYYYEYTIGNYYYPLPSYVGAINDIDLDARISRFHNSNISNGLAPSMMLTFRNGIPTVDEQDEIWRDIERSFSGEENAGKFFVNFAEPGREPTVETIENANDDYYILLEERVSSRVLTAHRITSPLLLGIKDASGFSSNAEEIKTAYAHFVGTVIEPERKKLLKSFNKIVNLTGLTAKLEVIPSEILIIQDEDTTEVITEEPNNTEE
jgi:hypothetical protein